ncbi:MAG: RNA polymerase sigma factor [Porphyromonadaceae bacterium]|nr:RNA polymerase sigma factor [Porphyromonadaceae bacterium]
MDSSQFKNNLINIQDNMRSLAISLTSNVDDAEDLVQETSLRVLNNKEKFKDNVNFKGWVLTVMRNMFINNYHRVVRSQTIIDANADPYNQSVLDDGTLPTPDSTMDYKEISKAIDLLPEAMRIPFTMYVSGYKYNEISDALDLPLGTVKSRIFFARKELQEKLKNFL